MGCVIDFVDHNYDLLGAGTYLSGGERYPPFEHPIAIGPPF